MMQLKGAVSEKNMEKIKKKSDDKAKQKKERYFARS
jgi:hypothetical protein